MRKDERANGVFVRAYAGVTGVLLAMNMDEKACEGLLGFAIEREAPSYAANKRHKWLAGLLAFPGQKHKAGERRLRSVMEQPLTVGDSQFDTEIFSNGYKVFQFVLPRKINSKGR